jgi:ankyrin repeat protein
MGLAAFPTLNEETGTMADPRISTNAAHFSFARIPVDQLDPSPATSADGSEASLQRIPRLHGRADAEPACKPPARAGLQWKPGLSAPPELVARQTMLQALTRQDRDGMPPLIAAMLDGDYDFALELLAAGASPSRQCALLRHPAGTRRVDPGTSALTLLAQHPVPVDFVKSFLAEIARHQQHQQLNDSDGFGQTPLGLAVCNRDTELTALLLQAGADPNHADRRGDTPLCLAVRWGDTACVAQLLDAGARPDLPDGHDDAPLTIAARVENRDLLLQLRAHRADAALNLHYRRALDACYRRSDIETLTRLSALSPLCQREVAAFLLDRLVPLAQPAAEQDSAAEDGGEASSDSESSGGVAREEAPGDSFAARLRALAPLLSDEQLGELALATTSAPGDAAESALALVRGPLPSALLQALRQKAARHGKAQVYEWAARRDPDLLNGDDAALSRELRAAVAAGSVGRAQALVAAGARFGPIPKPSSESD